MCLDPVTMGVMTFAVGAAQTAIQYGTAQNQYDANAEAAEDQHAIDQRQLTERQMQEQEAAAQARQLQNLQEAEVVSEARVAQADYGVAGASVENLVADVRRRAARNRQVQDENTRTIVRQLQTEKEASSARGEARIASVAKPSPLSLVAGIGADALGGYNTYNKFMG